MKKNVWFFWFSDDRKDGELQHCVSTSKLKKKKAKKERESGEWKHKQAALEKEKKKKKEGEQPSSKVSATTKIPVTLSYF